MLIQARSRNNTPESEASSDRLRPTQERTGPLPLVLAGLFTGLAAYFKSFITGSQASSDLPHAPALPHQSSSRGNAGLRPEAVDTEAPRSASSDPEDQHLQLPRGSVWDDAIHVSHMPPYAYNAGPNGPAAHLHLAFPAVFAYRPTNDNVPKPAASVHQSAQSHGMPPTSAPIGSTSYRPAHDPNSPQPAPDPEPGAEDPPASGNGSNAGNPPPKPNRAPTISGPARLGSVISGQAFLFGLGDLLLQAQDADGDELHVESLQVRGGDLTVVDDGWSYHTNPGAHGQVTISYLVSDGTGSVEATALLDVLDPVRTLTAGDDRYVGTTADDEVIALAGNDNIDVREGDDSVYGDDGDDIIMGGDGDDLLFGGAGDDTIFGGNGNDHIAGGAGNDRLFGDAGDDMVFGDDGNDRLFGGPGNDLLFAGAGNDYIEGDDGNDTIVDGDGDDIVLGGDGDDRLVVGAGNDRLDGGEGADTLDLSASTHAVVIDFRLGTATGVDIGSNSVSNVEVVVCGSGDDTIIVAGEGLCLAGGPGSDSFLFSTADAVAAEVASSGPVVHQIIDFAPGDHVKVDDYSFADFEPDAQQQFDLTYGDAEQDGSVLIRIRDDRYDDMDHTVIEADINHTNTYDLWIDIVGAHDLRLEVIG